MLAQPVSSVQADMRKQLEYWKQSGVTAVALDGARELPQLFALLAGETAAAGTGQDSCGWPHGDWMRAYALQLGFAPGRGTGSALSAPQPDASTPWDPLWHALQLGAPDAPRALSVRQLDRTAFPLQPSSLRLRDLSLPYHLCQAASGALGFRLRGRPAALLQHSFAFELEAMGCWHAMLYVAAQPAEEAAPASAGGGVGAAAAASAAAAATASAELFSRVLGRFPPPDELDAATLALLDARPLDAPPHLTRATLELALDWLDGHVPHAALLCAMHTALAWRARAQGRPRGEVRHLLQAAAGGGAGAASLWAEAHETLVARVLPAEVLRNARASVGAARAVLQRIERSGVAVPRWAIGGQLYLLFIDTTEKLRALQRDDTAAEVLADGRREALLEQAADVDKRAARRVAELVEPQLRSQEASCGHWLPETALELAALDEMRRRVKLIAEAIESQFTSDPM